MLTFTDEREHPGGGKAKTSDESEEFSAMCSRYLLNRRGICARRRHIYFG
jgi:hypothetical protein